MGTGDEKGVPNFWLTALKSYVEYEEEIYYISKRDEEALIFLKDIKWCRVDHPKGFKLDFFFDTNPFFKNSVLTKTCQKRGVNKDVVKNVTWTDIEWFPGKCLTKKMQSKYEFGELRYHMQEDYDDYEIGSVIRDKIILTQCCGLLVRLTRMTLYICNLIWMHTRMNVVIWMSTSMHVVIWIHTMMMMTTTMMKMNMLRIMMWKNKRRRSTKRRFRCSIRMQWWEEMVWQQPQLLVVPPHQLLQVVLHTSSRLCLYVGDLDINVTDTQLYQLFNQAGQVISVRICRDFSTGRSLGYGFVNYSNPQDAVRAVETFDFATINGKSIRVKRSYRDPIFLRVEQ